MQEGFCFHCSGQKKSIQHLKVDQNCAHFFKKKNKVWDKLSLVTASGQEIGTLDRQAFAMTASYDLKRADGQKFGRHSAEDDPSCSAVVCSAKKNQEFWGVLWDLLGFTGISYDLHAVFWDFWWILMDWFAGNRFGTRKKGGVEYWIGWYDGAMSNQRFSDVMELECMTSSL